jgi:hypothetical protein
MESIADVISYVKYGRVALLEAIAGLSQRELTQVPVYDSWTVKDILAHIIGWDQRVIKILPLIVQDMAGQVPGVDVETHNRQSVAAWKDRSLAEVMAALEAAHLQIIDILSGINFTEIDRRHDRNGRVITIRSYIIEVMVEHERLHAAEIELWRKALELAIDPAAIKRSLEQQRTHFMDLLSSFNQANNPDKKIAGTWSLSDLVGHVADWEQRIVDAAHHIYDPARPPVPPLSNSSEEADWNEMMAAKRAGKSWQENYADLQSAQQAMDNLLEALKPGDWKLRGPYPWPNDQGTLAELIIQAAEHYEDHLPDLEKLSTEKDHEPKP